MNRLLALSLCVSVLAFVGCKESGSGKRQIGVIPKGTTHEHWKGVEAGAKKAAAEMNVEIIWKGPLKEDDRAGQIQIVEQMVTDGVAGIVLAPLDDKALLRPVQQAAGKKIPVVIMDSPLAGELNKDFISLVATDNKKGGYLGGKRLAEVLGGKGKVVLLRYQENSASTAEREAGFMDAMKEAPGITLISSNQYAGATADSAQKKAESMLDVLRDADGIFCPNESSTQGMLNALERAGLAGESQKVKFVGFDKSVPLLKAMEEGKIQGLVAQNPEKMGYESVKVIVNKLDGKPVEPNVDTGVIVITKENLGSPEVKALIGR
ncbi:ABC transporter substrate-binding protein [Humisphaera borealis]|uniref:Substrate-binding domain-containing protein n=1 Tax=Humisphaera borealis TaxID=2807512 RepID=A0A7M2WUU9_9BACT|nr:substrate-binding domain-containing protein [Humisphaera borealis]QOV88581.1 substrate-binding domain-containing protein [Humisphaera borealis]